MRTISVEWGSQKSESSAVDCFTPEIESHHAVNKDPATSFFQTRAQHPQLEADEAHEPNAML